jgi:hypothetical protein
MPFLAVPSVRNQQFRYFTSERSRWLAHEAILGAKYTFAIWGTAGCLLLIYHALQMDWLERQYPSPHEWKLLTRLRFRVLMWLPDQPGKLFVDWVEPGEHAKTVLARLEDPNIDGAGLQDLTEGGMWIDGIGNSGYDITAKSEPWRRGYHEVLMMCGKCAENLDGYVLDTKRKVAFPGDQVWGPSHPNPTPIEHGSKPAPHEDDVVPYYEPPETYYLKILTTRGFTTRQKMDAALAYANWLDFKDVPEAAERMLQWSLQLATENTPQDQLPYSEKTLVLQEDVPRRPSANVLTVLTAIAVHKARHEDKSSAMPMLISILRSRRSLAQPSASDRDAAARRRVDKEEFSPWTWLSLQRVLGSIIVEHKYPAPPEDGFAPPVRDAAELCEEAALNLYIGEIIYAASKGNLASREEGLAWTREAVDISEEQLHNIGKDAHAKTPGIKECRECLATGLDNWAKMVARLAKEEERISEEKKVATSQSSGWLGLWSQTQSDAQDVGRWAAEERVVTERTKRAQPILEELRKPSTGLGFMFWA